MVQAKGIVTAAAGALALGFTGAGALNPAVPRLIRTFRRERPGVALRLVEANSIALREDLVAGRLDVALLRPAASDPAEITCTPLVSEPLIAAVPRALDPEPGRADLALGDLADLPLILTPRAFGISLHDCALEACRAAGFEPVLGQPAPQIASILSLVAAEQGVSLVPDSMQQFRINGVVFRKINGSPPTVGLAIASQRAGTSAPADNFIRLARALRQKR